MSDMPWPLVIFALFIAPWILLAEQNKRHRTEVALWMRLARVGSWALEYEGTFEYVSENLDSSVPTDLAHAKLWPTRLEAEAAQRAIYAAGNHRTVRATQPLP